jgi:alcohol dehydrogenase, propanol-preferring
MRAMQIIEWGKPLEAREYPDSRAQGEEVLLRVEAAGVCHSDVHNLGRVLRFGRR